MKLFVYLRALIKTVVETIFFRKKQKSPTNRKQLNQKRNKTLYKKEAIVLPSSPTLNHDTENKLQVMGQVRTTLCDDKGTRNFDSEIFLKDRTTGLLTSTEEEDNVIESFKPDVIFSISTLDDRLESYEGKPTEVDTLFFPNNTKTTEESDPPDVDFTTDKRGHGLTIVEPADEAGLLADTYPEELEDELNQLSLFSFEPEQIVENVSTSNEEDDCPQEYRQVETAFPDFSHATAPSSSNAVYRKKVVGNHQKCPFLRKPLIRNPECAYDEIDNFLKDLENDNLDKIFLLPVDQLENLFINTLRNYQYIGDLPISKRAYEQLIDYQRRTTPINRKIDPRYSSPAIFTICMVFCARYAETEAREFWKPFSTQVWKSEPTQNFMNLCRKLFVYSRGFLSKYSGLSFDFLRAGDVVRPVYQHATIPSYLQEHFVNWLVDHFETLLLYPLEHLPQLLKYDKSLDHVPPRLREFIRGEDTTTTAARLIARMSSAINLFHDLGQTEAVESVINSTFEKSLWEVIYKKTD